MACATERKLLVCSRRGDAISIGWRIGRGWKAEDREPIAEWIETLGRGRTMSVTSAFEIIGKLGYDYTSKETESCPAGHLGGGFMSIRCMVSGVRPADLLRPVYDLCARLSSPRIWYDQAESGSSRGEYCIEEPRAVFLAERSEAVLGRWDLDSAGTYYPSHAKILALIEQLTTPGAQPDVTAMMKIRRMIREDAFFISRNTKRNCRDGNREATQKRMDADWKLAQERMAARAVWYMRNNPWTEIGSERWLDISWPLEMPNGHSSIERLGRLDGEDARAFFVPLLRLLKDDDRIHLVDAPIPSWLYVDGAMSWAKHRPDDDSLGSARSAKSA